MDKILTVKDKIFAFLEKKVSQKQNSMLKQA